jgi:hypothetical protein
MKMLYQIEIIFNDYHRLAQSSLVETNYTFRFYRLFNNNSLDLEKINSTLIFNLTDVKSLNQRIVIDNLMSGAYLIEVIIF